MDEQPPFVIHGSVENKLRPQEKYDLFGNRIITFGLFVAASCLLGLTHYSMCVFCLSFCLFSEENPHDEHHLFTPFTRKSLTLNQTKLSYDLEFAAF
jgi:hypothetical protein